jgi:DNA-binding MarR family transcriptional regulator
MVGDEATLARDLRALVFQMYYVVRRATTPDHQLTPTQSSVLRGLVRHGAARMSTLAEAEGVKLPTMTDVVRRLVRLGLVRREPDPADRRAVLVSVTDSGLAYYREAVAVREAYLRDRLAGLSEEDRSAIATALPALYRLLDLTPDTEHTPEEVAAP